MTLRGLTIEGCMRKSRDAFIHIESVDHILVKDLECFDNTNRRGPSCISGSYSTVSFHNITATGNKGFRGGTLGLVNSRILIEDGKFQNNNASKDGGAVHLFNCDLNMTNTIFMENNAEEGGGAVAVEVGHSIRTLQWTQGVLPCGIL